MQSLQETLFESALAAQLKYNLHRDLYGLHSSTVMADLVKYECLHDIIERAGLISDYLAYFRAQK